MELNFLSQGLHSSNQIIDGPLHRSVMLDYLDGMEAFYYENKDEMFQSDGIHSKNQTKSSNRYLPGKSTGQFSFKLVNINPLVLTPTSEDHLSDLIKELKKTT